MNLSVLIPALANRRKQLAQVFAAFQTHYPEAQLLSVEGYTWGAGLNQLARQATGSYWLTCCDDTIPHPGCIEAARAQVDAGLTPQSRYYHPNGEPLNPQYDCLPEGPAPWSRSFLLTPQRYDEIGPFLDATWFADIEYSERLNDAGYQVTVCPGFAFTHLETTREWRTPEEAAREEALYQESLKRRRAA